MPINRPHKSTPGDNLCMRIINCLTFQAQKCSCYASVTCSITHLHICTCSKWKLITLEHTTTTLHLFKGLFSRTTWASWHQKGKQLRILLEQEKCYQMPPYSAALHLCSRTIQLIALHDAINNNNHNYNNLIYNAQYQELEPKDWACRAVSRWTETHCVSEWPND